jgi:ABC-type phosphate transport system permease subunit
VKYCHLYVTLLYHGLLTLAVLGTDNFICECCAINVLAESSENLTHFLTANLMPIGSVLLFCISTQSQDYHTQYMLLTHAHGLLCLQVRTVGVLIFFSCLSKLFLALIGFLLTHLQNL